MITLGILLAAPICCLIGGRPYMKFILVPVYFLISLGLDFVISVITLRSYSKKLLFKNVFCTNITILTSGLIIETLFVLIL